MATVAYRGGVWSLFPFTTFSKNIYSRLLFPTFPPPKAVGYLTSSPPPIGDAEPGFFPPFLYSGCRPTNCGLFLFPFFPRPASLSNKVTFLPRLSEVSCSFSFHPILPPGRSFLVEESCLRRPLFFFSDMRRTREKAFTSSSLPATE